MKKLLSKLIVIAGLAIGLTCQAADTNKAGDKWVLTLSGQGNTALNDDAGTVLGGELGLGRTGKILLPAEGGVRQSFGYATQSDDAVFNTRLYLDVFPVKFKMLEVGAGVNAGTTWGNTPVVYSFAPEGVVRLWLTEKAGIFGRVEFPVDLGNNKLGDRLNYFVGLAIRF